MELCPFESKVLQLTRLGQEPGEELQVHLDSCSSCQEVRGLAGGLRSLASATPRDPADEAPSTTQLWWKAHLRRRRAQSSDALASLRVAEIVVPVVLVLAAIAVLAIKLPAWLAGSAIAKAVTQVPTNVWTGAGVAIVAFGSLVAFFVIRPLLSPRSAHGDRSD